MPHHNGAPPRRTTDPGLPYPWARSGASVWTGGAGRRWRHVRRRDVARLTDEQWQTGMLLLRTPTSGWLPCGREGQLIGNFLIQLCGPTGLSAVLLMVESHANGGNPRDVVAAAVRDRRAQLAVLVPAEER